MDIHVHPITSANSGMNAISVTQATEINNRALQLSDQGDLSGAELLHLQALQMKLAAVGENHSTTAVTRNALGELYLKMGRLDDAESQFRRALAIRTTRGTVLDAAVSAENLGRLHEARGNLVEARAARLSYDRRNIVCGNYEVCSYTTSPSCLGS
jgi:tetratricopeptide (TPR) repeat protein